MKQHKLDTRNLPELDKPDKEKLHSLTEDEINAAALSDLDARPLSDNDLEHLISVPNPRRIREKLGMSQALFAETYHLNLRTLQDWEQGRRSPDASTRTFLTLILNFPNDIKSLIDAAHTSTQ
jgi:putative transcriptional regulator